MQILLAFLRCQCAREAGDGDFDQVVDINGVYVGGAIAAGSN